MRCVLQVRKPLTNAQIRALHAIPKGGKKTVENCGDGLSLVNEPVVGDVPCRRFVHKYVQKLPNGVRKRPELPLGTYGKGGGRLTLAKAIAKANLRRAEAGEKPITMNSLAVLAGVAVTTVTRLARTDEKAASALSLDLAGKIVTVLECGVEDLLEVVEY